MELRFLTGFRCFWPQGASKSSLGRWIHWKTFDSQPLGTILDLIRAKFVMLLLFSRISALVKTLCFLLPRLLRVLKKDTPQID